MSLSLNTSFSANNFQSLFPSGGDFMPFDILHQMRRLRPSTQAESPTPSQHTVSMPAIPPVKYYPPSGRSLEKFSLRATLTDQIISVCNKCRTYSKKTFYPYYIDEKGRQIRLKNCHAALALKEDECSLFHVVLIGRQIYLTKAGRYEHACSN